MGSASSIKKREKIKTYNIRERVTSARALASRELASCSAVAAQRKREWAEWGWEWLVLNVYLLDSSIGALLFASGPRFGEFCCGSTCFFRDI